MQIALYGRVSTHDKGQDHENQFLELRRFAAKWDWEIVKEYVDYVSASGKCVRTEFEKMMEDARVRKFDLIFFWSLDRFTREGPHETLDYLRNLNNWKVGWKSYTEQYLDSTGIFKEAIIAIIGTIAKQERLRIQERVRAGMDKARLSGTKSGLAIGGQRKIFRRDLAEEMRLQGKSLREIGKALGVPHMTIARALKEQGVSQSLPAPIAFGDDFETGSTLQSL